MESNSYSTGLRVSGNLSADCTLLVTNIFDLFPSSFHKLIPLLETQYRIVSYCDNGFDIFNRTKYPRHETMQGYANDLVASLQKEGINNIIYLAHSVNAMLAFFAAIKEPQLFDKLILLSAIPFLKKDLSTQYQSGFDADINNNILFDSIMKSESANNENEEQLSILLKHSLAKIDVEKAKLIFNILMTTDCRNLLDNITIPVMILQGIGDKIVTSETAYFLHRRIPDSYIVKIRAKGHLPQLNAPEEIFRAMQIFMYPAIY